MAEEYHTKRLDNPRYPPLARAFMYTQNFHPTLSKYKTAIDLGSSCGSLLLEMTKINQQLSVVGVDHSVGAKEIWCVPEEKGRFIQADFNKDCTGLLGGQKFDLITCTEVAEHLIDGEYLLNLIDEISSGTSVLIFSAAVPGQKGRGHINCHWHGYWMKKLEERGWLYNHQMTSHCFHEIGKANGKRKKTVPRYYLNIMVFQQQADLSSEDGLLH